MLRGPTTTQTGLAPPVAGPRPRQDVVGVPSAPLVRRAIVWAACVLVLGQVVTPSTYAGVVAGLKGRAARGRFLGRADGP